jgi:hypothetical protein
LPPDLEKNFYVEPLPQEDRHDPKTKTWFFCYSLRPKRAAADRIPTLRLVYYQPQLRRYQTSFSRAIPLHIKQRPKVIVAPERMYHVAAGEQILRSMNDDTLPWTFLGLGLLIPPACCLIWCRVWRHCHPSAAAQAGRRRSRAARQALLALSRLRDDPFGKETAAVVGQYLQQRLPLAALEPTPGEVKEGLLRAGLAEVLTRQAGTFFQACEDSRFAPPEVPRVRSLQSEAAELIEALEKGTC